MCLPSARAGLETAPQRGRDRTGSAAGQEPLMRLRSELQPLALGGGELVMAKQWWWVFVWESRVGWTRRPLSLSLPPYCDVLLHGIFFGRGGRCDCERRGRHRPWAPRVSYHSLSAPATPGPPQEDALPYYYYFCSHPCARWAHRDHITSCHVRAAAQE